MWIFLLNQIKTLLYCIDCIIKQCCILDDFSGYVFPDEGDEQNRHKKWTLHT